MQDGGENLEREGIQREIEPAKISVVVPVYNAECFLRQCLDSIRNQTLEEIEIICVDDCSTDYSLEILREYQKKDARLIVLQNIHTENSGAGPARNIGIQRAGGKYLAILDADDFFETDMLEAAYNRAEYTQAQITIYSDIWEYNHQTGKEVKAGNTQFFPEKEIFSGLDVAEYLFQITKAAAWRGIFLRKYIMEKQLRFPEKDSIGMDDLPFTYGALALADRITILKGAAFVHHRLCTGQNQSANVNIRSVYNAFAKLKERLDKELLFDKYQCSFINSVMRFLIPVLSAQNYEMVKGELSEKLDLYPYLDYPVNKIYDLNAWREYKRIMELSAENYFSEKAMVVGEYRLPQKIRDCNVKIILYGAGICGRKIYENIMQYNICKVLRWVDRNYVRIGLPVQDPSSLDDLKYDYVLIAIIDRETAQEVKKVLMDKGVEEKKILSLGNF